MRIDEEALSEAMKNARAALDAVALLADLEHPDVPAPIVDELSRATRDAYRAIVEAHPWECFDCGLGLLDDDAVWSDPDGVLSTDVGDPYCAGCVPDQPDYDKETR
jgi:hypothetical protein